MPTKYRIDDIVKLKSGRIGKIFKVIAEDPEDLAYKIQYWVQVSETERLIVNGLDVQGGSDQHHWNRRKRGVTDYQSEVLDQYTGPKFKDWNVWLRAGKAPTVEMSALNDVISRAPTYTGYVYRALKFDSADKVQAFAAGFIAGHPYVTPQFLSTSKNAASTHAFKGDVFGAFMRIYTHDAGGSLREFTGSNDMGEDEVLFSYSTRFDVLEVATSTAQCTVQLKLAGSMPPRVKKGLEIPLFKKKT